MFDLTSAGVVIGSSFFALSLPLSISDKPFPSVSFFIEDSHDALASLSGASVSATLSFSATLPSAISADTSSA